MRQKVVAGNWKMNGSIKSIRTLAQGILQKLPNSLTIKCLVFPPAIYLPLIKDLLQETSLQWGSQNVYPKDSGAFTGELSCPMLRDFGCRYVLVGHSERRHLFGENENIIQEKFHKVKEHDMIPILCVGETLKEREMGLTDQVLTQQLSHFLSKNPRAFENALIAYEPVWAIGTGCSASADQVQTAHKTIRGILASGNAMVAEHTPILYGGSLNEHNAAQLLALADVDGGLIGGASLDAQKFVEIITCIN